MLLSHQVVVGNGRVLWQLQGLRECWITLNNLSTLEKLKINSTHTRWPNWLADKTRHRIKTAGALLIRTNSELQRYILLAVKYVIAPP